MSKIINDEKYTTLSDYLNDKKRINKAEKAEIEFEASLIGKLIEARESKGLSQRELAELCGIKQPAIARIEKATTTPRIDTLFKILSPLGYTLSIVPVGNKSKSTQS